MVVVVVIYILIHFLSEFCDIGFFFKFIYIYFFLIGLFLSSIMFLFTMFQSVHSEFLLAVLDLFKWYEWFPFIIVKKHFWLLVYQLTHGKNSYFELQQLNKFKMRRYESVHLTLTPLGSQQVKSKRLGNSKWKKNKLFFYEVRNE